MKQRRVLIVDDDPQISEGVQVRLRAAGYQTLIAHDGVEGLAMARHQRPDAIVLDVRLPKMNGLEALAELKSGSDTTTIPVVMLSASVIDEPEALESGARFFVRKPYSGATLVEAVNVAADETSIQHA